MSEISRRAILTGVTATVASAALPLVPAGAIPPITECYLEKALTEILAEICAPVTFTISVFGLPDEIGVGSILSGNGIGDCVIVSLQRAGRNTEVVCAPIPVDHGAWD